MGGVSHKGQAHDGLHDPIVDQETWDRVQLLLAEHAQRRAGNRQNSDALLAGKLFDDRGNRMSSSHAAKDGQRWRYYVSQAVLQGRKHEAGSVARVPALEIERGSQKRCARPRPLPWCGVDRNCISRRRAAAARQPTLRDAPERRRCNPTRRHRACRHLSNDNRDRTSRRDGERRSNSRPDHPLDAAVAPPSPRDHPRRGRQPLRHASDENRSARGRHRRAFRRSTLGRRTEHRFPT